MTTLGWAKLTSLKYASLYSNIIQKYSNIVIFLLPHPKYIKAINNIFIFFPNLIVLYCIFLITREGGHDVTFIGHSNIFST